MKGWSSKAIRTEIGSISITRMVSAVIDWPIRPADGLLEFAFAPLCG